VTGRIPKIIANRGVMSRRNAERLIVQGRVMVDGVPAGLGQSADPEKQVILIDGKPLPPQPELVYVMFHKPRGVVTTRRDSHGRPDIRQMLPKQLGYLVPAGRLDIDSEGLLIATNDGDLVQYLTHPSHEIKKVYNVQTEGNADRAVPVLRGSIVLDGVELSRAEVKKINNNHLQITISQGKNRQVRRMCGYAGLTVKRLVRVRVGTLDLGDLACGKWRHLTAEEVQGLRRQ